MEGGLVTGKKPKSVPVPVPGKADSGDGEKRGPGRPKGSGKKTEEDGESLGLLITAGLQMLAVWRAEKKGPHWLPLAEKAPEIGTLAAKVIDKYFPASKFTKYADEARLVFLVGQVVGPALLVDLMTPEPEQQKGGQAQNDDPNQRPGGSAPVRPIRREEVRPSHDGPASVRGVKQDLPALG